MREACPFSILGLIKYKRKENMSVYLVHNLIIIFKSKLLTSQLNVLTEDILIIVFNLNIALPVNYKSKLKHYLAQLEVIDSKTECS